MAGRRHASARAELQARPFLGAPLGLQLPSSVIAGLGKIFSTPIAL